MSVFKSNSASVMQGGSVITCTDNQDFSSLPSGSLIILEYNKAVIADSGTASVGGTSTINLRDPYPGALANVNNGDLLAYAGVPALVEAVANAKTASDNMTATRAALQTIIDNQGTAATEDIQTSPTDATADRLLTVGAFGIGGNAETINNWDADLNVTRTFYAPNGTANPPHTAAQNWGGLRVNSANINNGFEMGLSLNDFYFRTEAGATYGGWNEVYHSGNSVNPLDFGFGQTAGLSTNLNLASSFDASITAGSYFISGNVADGPNATTNERGTLLVQTETNASSQAFGSQIFIERSSNRMWFRKFREGVFSEWDELYHSGNTNFNEFGGNSANDSIAVGYGRFTTVVYFNLPISSTENPTGITVNGTFRIFDPTNNSILATGVTPTIQSSSSNKLLILEVTGLSGVALGATYVLQVESSSNSITLNY